MTVISILTLTVSMAALSLAVYSLYLQRKDRKPRLQIEPSLTLRKIKLTQDDYGGAWHKDDFCMVLILRNPTDKDIQVGEVAYVNEEGVETVVVPFHNLPLVPSHRTAEVIIKLENLVGPMGMKTKGIGHFIVKDVLGNVSKSGETFRDLSDRRAFFPTQDEYYEWIKNYPVDSSA